MDKMILLIDSNSLCYKGFYTLGVDALSTKDGKSTGIIFSFMKQILFLAEKFNTNKFIFCWDSKKSYRKLIYPEYKANRKNKTPEELYRLKKAYIQFQELRKEILPRLGFNCFMQVGFEADDLITKFCMDNNEKIMIVSEDKDLYQLLDLKNVSIWNGKKIIQDNEHASNWANIKAIAGDVSDNIKGVKGVGEKTAIKYFTGELKRESKAYQNIIASKELIEKNKLLVTLPYKYNNKEPQKIEYKWNRMHLKKFREFFKKYEFDSLDISRFRSAFELKRK